jgi:sugar phosphate isomerase/epimerase
MKISFSTLACPEWTVPQVIQLASASHYEGVELRFIEGQDALWKLPAFQGSGLASTKRALADAGLSVACVDTSCHFHWPDAGKRALEMEEGARMAELAAALGAPGIRVFGDKVQPGATRDATRGWVAESVGKLAERVKPQRVEVWIESHGDFATSAETAAILKSAGSRNAGAVWDSANCFIECGEQPMEGARNLGAFVRHVHIKDLEQHEKKWQPAVPGTGSFAMHDVVAALQRLHYSGFVSFEWEKKWYPSIPDASVAVPAFADWYRRNAAA